MIHNTRMIDCRECNSPILEGVDGIVTGVENPKGWCNTCIKAAIPLISCISEMAIENLDFEDFLKMENERSNTDDSKELEGTHCPECNSELTTGSFFSACEKCRPLYFKHCFNCEQLIVNCICDWERIGERHRKNEHDTSYYENLL